MKKTILLFLIAFFNNSFAAVDQAQQQNAICYLKANAPELLFGKLPFSCEKKPEKFVSSVKKEVGFLSETTIIPNLKTCLQNLFDKKNMVNVARGVWDLRDSPVLSTNAATASAISDTCKSIENTLQQEKNGVNSPREIEEPFPNNVKTTWSYKPFVILSSKLGKEMSDVSIAKKFVCKSPAETLQETMELLQNYDLVDSSKTDGTLTVTSFRGVQQGKRVTVSLAVDEQSRPRIVRYILVDGMPALNCY